MSNTLTGRSSSAKTASGVGADDVTVRWRRACATLAAAERSGSSEADLERLADDVIASRLVMTQELGRRGALLSETGRAQMERDQLLMQQSPAR